MNVTLSSASQSLILDLGDDHWKDVFTSKELDKIRKENGLLVRTLPPALEEKLEELKQLIRWAFFLCYGSSGCNSALEAYFYALQVKHDPINEYLMSWLGFINKNFHGSSVKAYGKEKSSKANSMARNGKRKLSAVDGVDNKKMGSRTDTLYEANGVELGCLEISSKVDPSKELKDSLVKMEACY
ncbi:hypothetical protein INT45_004918 [Circinella minor]|uniref:Uncharacterized protein n=1 Tax=Circinella minor TaxID=1195481 RepID=A0A8H7RI34_9FUNG|nr:hypothetical protein INT45_004918 [Circinella minor]